MLVPPISQHDTMKNFYLSNDPPWNPWNLDPYHLIERFERVESHASTYSITELHLLDDIHYLLKGKALNWC